MLDAGAYTSITEIAEAERINRSYVSRILRLTLLAPEVIEQILDSRIQEVARLTKPFPLDWEKQRKQFC
jgi:hypothetical protein